MKEHNNLMKIKQKALEEHIPIIMDDTLEVIGKVLKENKPRTILEIGTAVGYSAICFSEYLDEGSIEYLYENYTILEINEKNGNIDLIIGMKGSIIGDYKANIENYNTKEARDSYLNEINKNFHFQDSVED